MAPITTTTAMMTRKSSVRPTARPTLLCGLPPGEGLVVLGGGVGSVVDGGSVVDVGDTEGVVVVGVGLIEPLIVIVWLGIDVKL